MPAGIYVPGNCIFKVSNKHIRLICWKFRWLCSTLIKTPEWSQLTLSLLLTLNIFSKSIKCFYLWHLSKCLTKTWEMWFWLFLSRKSKNKKMKIKKVKGKKSCKRIGQEYVLAWPKIVWYFLKLQWKQKLNLIAHIVFKFFKFKTSDNLVGWEPMPDNGSPK